MPILGLEDPGPWRSGPCRIRPGRVSRRHDASDRSEVARKPGARRRWPRSTARFRILLFVGSTAGAGKSPPELQCWLGVRHVCVWFRSAWSWFGEQHQLVCHSSVCDRVSRCCRIDVMVAPTMGIRGSLRPPCLYKHCCPSWVVCVSTLTTFLLLGRQNSLCAVHHAEIPRTRHRLIDDLFCRQVL